MKRKTEVETKPTMHVSVLMTKSGNVFGIHQDIEITLELLSIFKRGHFQVLS